MNLKLVTFIFLFVFAAGFSACSKAESRQAEEVVIDGGGGGSKDEVTITNADLKTENQTVSTTTTGGGLGKRFLSDKSFIETIVDGFGNRIETRHFPDNPRVSMVILRSSPGGRKEVTVYGTKGDTKFANELGDNALSASADEIASVANISSENKFTTTQGNFMKGSQPSTTSSTPLQPLPSSSFQQPVQQYPQTVQPNPPPVEPAQPQSTNNSETPPTPPAVPDVED